MPVSPQCVLLPNVGAADQREPRKVRTKRGIQFLIHLMVCYPDCNSSDVRWILLYFKCGQLMNIYAAQKRWVAHELRVKFTTSVDNPHLQPPQFAIGDHQEVAAPASGVEKPQPGELVVKRCQRTAVIGNPLKLFVEVIHK